MCPSRLLPSTVPDALLNISVGPGSSLPPSESSTPARLWVAGWRMVLTDGLATVLAVTLYLLAPPPPSVSPCLSFDYVRNHCVCPCIPSASMSNLIFAAEYQRKR